MESRLLLDGAARMYAVVFERAEAPIAGLTRFSSENDIAGAHLTAIGAFRWTRLGWFDVEAQDYVINEVGDQAEVVSLVGDITRAGPDTDEPKIHAHVVLGLRDGRALGGHLLEATVWPTLEVVVTETPTMLRRRHDPATGLALIDLTDRGSDAAPPMKGDIHGANRR